LNQRNLSSKFWLSRSGIITIKTQRVQKIPNCLQN